MTMTTEQMRAQLHEVLGACPIPDATLDQYATIIAGLSGTICNTAKTLRPEDTAADFAAFLDSFAEGADDVS